MSDEELLGIYRKAWDIYYSAEHVETVIRRAKAWGYDPRNMMLKLLTFPRVPRIENVHPLEGGLFRRKYRRDRRPGCLSKADSFSIPVTPGKYCPSTSLRAHVLATLAHPAPRARGTSSTPTSR